MRSLVRVAAPVAALGAAVAVSVAPAAAATSGVSLQQQINSLTVAS